MPSNSDGIVTAFSDLFCTYTMPSLCRLLDPLMYHSDVDEEHNTSRPGHRLVRRPYEHDNADRIVSPRSLGINRSMDDMMPDQNYKSYSRGSSQSPRSYQQTNQYNDNGTRSHSTPRRQPSESNTNFQFTRNRDESDSSRERRYQPYNEKWNHEQRSWDHHQTRIPSNYREQEGYRTRSPRNIDFDSGREQIHRIDNTHTLPDERPSHLTGSSVTVSG